MTLTEIIIDQDKQELAEQRRVRLSEIGNQLKALDTAKHILICEVNSHELWRGRYSSFDDYRERQCQISSAKWAEMCNGRS